MARAFVGGRLLNPDMTGSDWLEDYALIEEGGSILSLIPAAQLPQGLDAVVDLQGARLLPGFFDTQVNGGGGVLLNDCPDVKSIAAMMQAHAAYGTCAMLPTLISDELSVMSKAIDAVAEAIASAVPGIAGIHLEGPFLNPQRKGVHDAEKFRVINDDALSLLTSLKNGKTLVTLAPEQTTSDVIAQLKDAGVIVAAGHTAASYEQMRKGLDAGISSFTHLYNAMTPLNSREPGCVGAALEDRDSWCGVIVDGYHVHCAALKVAMAAKPRGKMVLVTDAMPTVGAKDKSFNLNGEVISAKDGRCATAGGTLAGSDLDMISAVRNTVNWLGVDLAEAARMASLYPAQMMGLDDQLGSLAPGRRASFVAVDADMAIQQVWLEGRLL